MALKAECEALKRDKTELEEQFKRESEVWKREKMALEEQCKKEAEARAAVQMEKVMLEQTRVEQVEAFAREYESLKVQHSYLNEQLERSSNSYLQRISAEVEHRESISQEVAGLRQQQAQYQEEHQKLMAERASLCRRIQLLEEDKAGRAQEQQDLAEDNRRLSMEKAMLQERHATMSSSACSESRLRAAMTLPSTTTNDLLQAVTAVEALLSEARREVGARQSRERRAAYEQLHHATEKADEAILAAALAEARRCGIDAEDIAKGQAKLEQLQSLTDEQRAAQAAQEAKVKIKAEAFQLVKRDDGETLVALLATLSEKGLPATCWQDWRDYAGRSLRQFAKEMRAASAQKSLTELFERQKPQEVIRTAVATPEIAAKVVPAEAEAALPSLPSNAKVQMPASKPVFTDTPLSVVDTPRDFVKPKAKSLEKQFKVVNLCEEMFSEETTSPASDATSPPSPEDTTPKALPVVPPEEEAQLKQKALRAVVADDVVTLSGVIDRLPVEVWYAWRNKGGKDLVTLSEERGATCAYSVLAKALGWLKEQKREVFEEREAVWVMVKGDLQPRQATVMEDTPEEADHILVEYWDDNDPPSYAERALVLKSCAR